MMPRKTITAVMVVSDMGHLTPIIVTPLLCAYCRKCDSSLPNSKKKPAGCRIREGPRRGAPEVRDARARYRSALARCSPARWAKFSLRPSLNRLRGRGSSASTLCALQTISGYPQVEPCRSLTITTAGCTTGTRRAPMGAGLSLG